MRALTMTLTLISRKFGEVFHDAGCMTSAGLLFYRVDRALD